MAQSPPIKKTNLWQRLNRYSSGGIGSIAVVAVTAVQTFNAGIRVDRTSCFKVYMAAHRALGLQGEPCIHTVGMVVMAAW
mmetsp:Transcript_21315/g.28745  ORF Transcript_21315/g.28745 Transcript_21315/m.28745 type:complete len:80 (+) Transcript_21315:247-486(+)